MRMVTIWDNHNMKFNLLKWLLTVLILNLASCDSRVIEIQNKSENTFDVYSMEWVDISGERFDATALKGSVTLVVNVASKCGYTKQYETLQKLHDKYESFQVIGFPCNDFGGQEPGNSDEIIACALTYDAKFPLMKKTFVIDGEKQNPIYSTLYEATKELPSWNFGKYLIDKKGAPVAFFGTHINPLSKEIMAKIEELLAG